VNIPIQRAMPSCRSLYKYLRTLRRIAGN